jgi:hypothetical protein
MADFCDSILFQNRKNLKNQNVFVNKRVTKILNNGYELPNSEKCYSVLYPQNLQSTLAVSYKESNIKTPNAPPLPPPF